MLQYKIPKSKTILHSIPIGSIMTLLLLFSFLVSPNIYYSNNSVYAAEEDNASNSMNNISTHANDTESSTSLIIGGAEMNEVVDASVGEVAYRKHTVTISASKLKSYTLFISGPEGLSGDTTITGANGNTPVDMPKNSWGYAYGQDGSENDMTYNSFTNNAELIDSKLESESTTDDTDFTKNLIFAVKFGNAIAGHYTGTVTLSLAAEPKEVVLPTNPVENWDELQSMQQMTSKACESIGTAGSGTYPSKTLVDSRDSNEYTITKLDDQNCWMTTNLKLDLSTTELTSVDSNVSTNTPLTWNDGSDTTLASSNSGFVSGTESTAKWNSGTGITNSNQWKEEYGYYYNWCAATAGSCSSATTNNAIAGSSICPKGWRLPTKIEYDNLLNKAEIVNDGTGYIKIGKTPYHFLAAGIVNNDSLVEAGSRGSYWIGAAYDAYAAYNLVFTNINVNTGYPNRYAGFPVRCIAQTVEDEKNIPVNNWADVEYMQQMSPQACKSAGTAGSGNYPSKTLKDSRDDNTYTVTKLDDQKCWMTQNLRIVNKKITAADSNVNSVYTIPKSSDPWYDTSATTNRVYYNALINNGNSAYYSWYTATASTQGNYYSICPKGWRLPTNDEYKTLLSSVEIDDDEVGSTKIQSAPYDFSAAGYVNNGLLVGLGDSGWYWSGTAYGSTTTYILNFHNNGMGVYSNGSRFYGNSVRCIAE